MSNKNKLSAKKRSKVFVGMSGGVDSSVAAYLLKKQGHSVVGVFMRGYNLDNCQEKDAEDARRVAEHLEIPFYVWDFEKEYKEKVVDYMIDGYRKGLTPNPDVMCNKEIKFGAFFRRAMKEGADFVATGHYAEAKRNKKTGLYEMFASIDETKDQSYFLWTLGQKELSRTLFPVGKFKKSAVRKLAENFGLPTATKKDSQGLCFVGKLEMKDFLSHFIKEKKGAVLNENGEKIGTHNGACFYTLGERHGFTITKKETNDAPYYIVAKDTAENTLTVAHAISQKPLECATNEIILHDTNFCTGIKPNTNKKYSVCVRYHGEPHDCGITQLSDKKLSLLLKKPAVVAFGQSAVIYDGSLCVGGGVVEGI